MSHRTPSLYTVTDLGTLKNPVAINNFGQIVGSTSPQAGQAFLWQPTARNSPAGKPIALGSLGGSESYATAINDDGHVTGYFRDGLDEPQVVLWTPASPNSAQCESLISLNFPPLKGPQFNPPAIYGGITQSDVVASDAGPTSHAALYVPGQPKIFELSGNFYYVAAVSKNGWITGSKCPPNLNTHAVCYKAFDPVSQPLPDFTSGEYYYLGVDLQGQGDWQDGSGGLAITEDDKGIVAVAASANDSKCYAHAILWMPTMSQPNNIIDINAALPAKPNAVTEAYALGINKHRQVVGWNISAGYAFRYDDASKVAVNLNDEIDSHLGWILGQANKINDSGQIIGTGRHNGVAAAFLLTPSELVVPPIPSVGP
jgi:hypothetical protein